MYGKAIGVILSMTEEIASQEIDFMEYGDTQINTIDMERGQRKDLIGEMPVGIAVVRGGNELYIEMVNREFLHAEGYDREELTGNTPFVEYLYRDDTGVLEDAIEVCRELRTTEEIELRIRTKSGGVCWELMRCRLYYYRDAVPYYILVSWNIDKRKNLEEELRLMEEQYSMLEEVTDEFPLEYDVAQRRFRVPRKYRGNGQPGTAGRRYMGYEEMLADICEEDRAAYARVLEAASRDVRTGSIDYRMNVAAAGEEPVYVWYRTIYRSIVGDNGQIIRIIGRSYDVSSDRRIQEELSEEAKRDPLTRLYNKVAASGEVERILKSEPEKQHVLFLIDIDNFKRINDTFGHTVGDTVITDIAGVMQSRFQETDVTARVGGDEFLALMRDATPEEAKARAAALGREARKKLIGDDAIVEVTLSIGMAVYGEDGRDYETLFAMADRAMYATKREGKDHYSFAGKKQQEGAERERRRDRIEYAPESGQKVDKEFLNFAFSLLSHAKDINGSLNVLIEQIGKKYGLGFAMVFEYREEQQEMVLMNYWNRDGSRVEQQVFPQSVTVFREAEIGRFVSAPTEDILTEVPQLGAEKYHGTSIKNCGNVKFEFSGNRSGCLCVGSSSAEGFSKEEAGMLSELARVVAVFVSLRSRQSDDQAEIRHLQNQDMLTELYNLDTFRRLIRKKLKSGGLAQDENMVYALVNLDVNNFAYVNENYGQEAGDSILQELAALIRSESHVVEACRMYSDYFIELVRGTDKKNILGLVEREDQMFGEQLKIRYPAGAMQLSAGICFIDDGEETFEKILEGANLARKLAKEQNAGAVVYRDDMRKKRDEGIRITGRFYAALQRGEFEVYLQPKFLLREERVYGAEALARWRLESGEILSPARFIPALENIGYIVDLDFYILEQLLRAMRRWRDSGRELFTISTNFSRRNFENGGDDFIERLQNTLQRYGIDPCYIEIEVTESVIVEKLDSLKACLTRLGKLGYRIAIDDFGTGYSSLSVLLEIPANVVKIDKSFTDKIHQNGQSAFVYQMGQFIQSAKEEVIFEGIEEEQQRTFLMECGFNYGQGYYFDRPLPMEEFEKKYI